MYTVIRANPTLGGDKSDTTPRAKNDTRGRDKEDTLTRTSTNESQLNESSVPQSPSDSSVRAPAAPKSPPLKARFLAATKVPERVAAVVDLFTREGVELTPQQKGHLGALLKRRGHGKAVWRATLAATTAEGDPIEMMEGGARSAEARNGHRRGTRVVTAADAAAARNSF